MSTNLTLPCGFEISGGIVERSCSVSRIKGKVQRDIARLAGKKNTNPAAINDAILKPTLKTIGEHAVDPMQISGLSLADRDWLVFQLHKATRGSLIEAKHSCTHDGCDEVSQYSIDIDEMPVTRLGDDVDWWDGEKVVSAEDVRKMSPDERKMLRCRALALKNEELDVEAVFRFPRGFEQREMGNVGDNPMDQIWKLMSVCLLKWRDDEIDKVFGDSKAQMIFWDDVDAMALTWAQEEFAAAQPGIENRIEVICGNGHVDTVGVSAIDFLFPKANKKG